MIIRIFFSLVKLQCLKISFNVLIPSSVAGYLKCCISFSFICYILLRDTGDDGFDASPTFVLFEGGSFFSLATTQKSQNVNEDQHAIHTTKQGLI